MSAAAVMLVRDEADIIEATLRHLLTQVDEILIFDNMSADGTREILDALEAETGLVHAFDDPDVGYYQSQKTTALARLALERGHRWVVPNDADEVWYVPDGRTLSAFLDGVTRDVQIVRADLYNHMPSALDVPSTAACPRCGAEPLAEGFHRVPSCPLCKGQGGEPNPVKRIGWRQREHGALPKVACRARPDLRIDMGNHSASTSGTGMVTGGLVIRHFSWRTEEQYLKKIRNGQQAYAATTGLEGYGEHWRMWENVDDDTIREHFRLWFYSENPHADTSLIFDPAPVSGQDI